MVLLLLLFSTLSFSAQSEIFLWIDGDGKKHFSDKPHHNAEVLQVNVGYTYHQVKKVYDADTVLLTNGNKVRFLGINTPETERGNKLAQAGGKEAKQWLVKILKNKKIRLEADVEKKDKYGRLLSYLFTEDKQHINLELVKRGLATVNIHPPNLKYTEQLLSAQQSAEKAGKGIWKHKEYTPKAADNIQNGRFKGWQRVIGNIKKIHNTDKYSYLNLTDKFSLKISRKSQALFPKMESYMGKKVEVRGWINSYKNRYSMFIRHPSAIILLNE
ncbi:MAG: thermonuclease family protein [Methylococcales symbiont of Iophon sp. n. MRB-2018]|nr:MAG: thermonuclease family protein [Methylococcales symbiont of Iophon sp. n. MRB-2018]KAF3980292.1 MAG: thermonuclease family protein [Methylococcales symbiont of Iophon sp. n. MRB-2018]